MDAEILAAVAAEEPAMVELLAELVQAATVLGQERRGQAIMRRAFAELGLEPFDVPLDRATLERHPGGAPISWGVAGKTNVLAADHPHPINLNIGMIRGGDWPSTVAGERVTNFRLALYPGQRVADLRERVERVVAAAARQGPALNGHRVEVL
jgi:acetylornithine deacetylase/succinyl-diaminopimelate desuccinylase-like protein